jgi:hypothetical protein
MPKYANKPKPGEQFDLWTVVADAPTKKSAFGSCSQQVLCRCACGKVRSVSVANLRAGKTHSCGCIKPKRTSERKMVHGDAKKGAIAVEYATWQAMLRRCDTPSNIGYPNYGGRGIKVCERWHDYRNFLADMGRRPPNLSLERKNVDGDYEPSNCIWATPREQRLNQRPRLRLDQFSDEELLTELLRRGLNIFQPLPTAGENDADARNIHP